MTLDVATGRDTARARRWLTRALFVVGGAMAGTAAAWAIGTASASAGPALQDPSLPHLTGAASDVVQPGSKDRTDDSGRDRHAVGDTVRATVGTVADGELAHAGSLKLVTDPPRQAPRLIGNALHPAPGLLDVLRPASGELLGVPALPLLEPPTANGPEAAPSGADTPLIVPEGQAGPVMSAPTAVDPHENEAGHTAARAGHHTVRHPLPGSVPSAPSHVPAPPAFPLPGGSAANAHVDAPSFGVPAPASAFTAADSLRCVRFGVRPLPVEPGTQPGVTPD